MMNRTNESIVKNARNVWLSFVLFFVFSGVQIASAGIWGDLKTWYDDRKAFAAHSTNIANAVREIYRERETMTRFNNSALSMIGSYKSAKAAGSIDLMKVVQMAPQMTALSSDYQKLEPKVQSVYNRITPDIEYFKKYQKNEDGSTIGGETTLSEGKISALSTLAGLSRVGTSIKESPTNIFHWGRLYDEYKYGKASSAYGLKGVQIALEMNNAYATVKGSVQELTGIKGDFNKISSGDLGALLNIGGTIKKINSADGSISKIETFLKRTPAQLESRFTELSGYQTSYLDAFKNYSKKYGDPEGRVLAKNSSNIQLSVATPTANSPSAATRGAVALSPQSSSKQPSPGNVSSQLPEALKKYETLYRQYTQSMTNSSVSDKQRQKIAEQLRQILQSIKQLKAAVK
ncbi:MAG: hypothetical protein WA705_22750 [Candidatus Ozemobacteraceae bacterium]